MSFKNSQYYKSVNKVREFMFEDLEKTIDLVNAPKKAPNFLLALVLCCYTEYWGRLVLGIPVGRSKKCFNEFFDRLGKCYQKRKQQGFDAYHDIRCGLVHSNVIDKSAKIRIEGDNCGIIFDQSVKEYEFHVRRYFEDFRKAVDNYLMGLESGSESVSLMEKALSGKPAYILTTCLSSKQLGTNLKLFAIKNLKYMTFSADEISFFVLELNKTCSRY